MKVIRQLTVFFWRQGSLASPEVERLIAKGFVRPEDLPGYCELPISPRLVEQEALQDEFANLPNRSRMNSRGRIFTEEQRRTAARSLGTLLHDEMERRRDILNALRQLLPGSGKRDWTASIVSVNQMDTDRFFNALTARLVNRPCFLNKLWRATDITPFVRLTQSFDGHWSATNALRALLKTPPGAALGKHAWIERYEEFRQLRQLRTARNQLYRAIGTLHRRRFDLLTRAVETEIDSIPFWALLLVHNARRPNQIPMLVVREYKVASFPTKSLWDLVITHAANIDEPMVVPFVSGLQQKAALQTDEAPWLSCPDRWRVPRTR